ncbi:MAG: hypothetical protein AUH69_01930 [Actinobacteria bacterium 13_1_40CM_4_65_12]|nr:MAG: hypothetical protein AUH69_01930 [Actinobacteria bacterium 13_1_40CM_4_65_12]OLD46802.1 MAG: hypothetical protein AUI48_06760 [Chloroflexi bacterium 13_1_40CM_2_68_14]
MPASNSLLGRILRANEEASRRFGENTAEVDAFIHATTQLTPWQWRQVLTARRLVSTVTKEDAAQATESLVAIKAAIGSSERRVSEPMAKAGEALLAALEKRSDDKVAAAWQALSALVMRQQLSTLKFAAHYAPFITLIPVSGFDGLDPTTMRFLAAVQSLTREKCELLARRWRLDHEASRALIQAVTKTEHLKAEEAGALVALRTIPAQLTGDLGWAAVKTIVHGGRVLASRADLSGEQVAVLWAPLEPAIELASMLEPAAKPVRSRVRARAPASRAQGPYGPNSTEVSNFIKSVVALSPIQWLRILDRRKLVASVTRQGGAEPAGVVRSLLAAIKGTGDLDMLTRCRAFSAVDRAAGTIAAKAELTHEESMRGYGAFGDLAQMDYVGVDGFAKLVGRLATGDWVKIADSVPAVNQDVVGPLVSAGSGLYDFLESRSDEEAVAAWEAASALVRRIHLTPIKFAASYAPFASAIPATNPKSLSAPVLRYVSAVSRLSTNQCAVLAQPWHVADDLSSALTRAAADVGARTAEEAAALAAVVTVPMRVSGSEGWAAAKTAAFGGRVLGSRSRLSLEHLEVLWRPIQAAIPLASLVAVAKSRR